MTWQMVAPKRLVHVVHGLAAGGALVEARRLSRRSVVTLVDDFAYGRLAECSSPKVWWALRREHLESTSG